MGPRPCPVRNRQKPTCLADTRGLFFREFRGAVRASSRFDRDRRATERTCFRRGGFLFFGSQERNANPIQFTDDDENHERDYQKADHAVEELSVRNFRIGIYHDRQARKIDPTDQPTERGHYHIIDERLDDRSESAPDYDPDGHIDDVPFKRELLEFGQ